MLSTECFTHFTIIRVCFSIAKMIDQASDDVKEKSVHFYLSSSRMRPSITLPAPPPIRFVRRHNKKKTPCDAGFIPSMEDDIKQLHAKKQKTFVRTPS